MQGVELYTSRAGIPVLRIHYTADPERNPATEAGREWIKSAPKGIPGGMQSSHWRQEQEIDWEAAGGDLVFPQFQLYRGKIVVPPFDLQDSGWRMYASFDYGWRNPSAFHVHAIDYDGNVWTVWEFYKSQAGYRDIAQAIRRCEYYSNLSTLPVADPSIYDRNQATETEQKSIGQLFMELPDSKRVIFQRGQKGGDASVADKVNSYFWADLETQDPKWRIFATCPKLIWELNKLRWAEWSGTQALLKNTREQIVDKDNHAWDGFKMFVQAFFSAPTKQEPKPYDHLMKTDPASYKEWRNVEKMHKRWREESGRQGTLGEFV